MGIVQDIENLKNEIADKSDETVTDTDDQALDEQAEDTQDTQDQDVSEESADDDVEATANDDTVTVDKEEKPEDNGHIFSKMRKLEREKEALLKALEGRENSGRQSVPQQEKKEDSDPEPDKDIDPEAWLLWENKQLRKEVSEVKQWKTQAEQERTHNENYRRAVTYLGENEKEFRSTFKDPLEYDGATSHMINKMKEGVKYIYPSANEIQVAKFVETQLLNMADSFAGQGLNPSRELYLTAVEKYGYVHKPEAKEAPKNASVKTVVENRKRSATSLNGGSSKDRVLPTVKELTTAQVGMLSREEAQRYMGASKK